MIDIIDMIKTRDANGYVTLRIVERPPIMLPIPNKHLRSPWHREAQRLGKQLVGDFETGEVKFI